MMVLKGINIPGLGGERLIKRDVIIKSGVYWAVLDPSDAGSYAGIKVIPCEGSVILPAFIDPHVHVREPGFDHKEDWTTCSRAALKGGVSAIMDMPNNKTPVDNYQGVKDKIKIAMTKSYVDFGVYIALTDSNADKLCEPGIQESVCGVKIYLSKTTGNINVSSPAALVKVFNQPRPVLVHTGGHDGLEKILYFYNKAAGKFSDLPILYICHVSTVSEIDLLKKWKRKYPSIMAEVTPHHLFLNRDDYKGLPGVLPPLAGKRDVDALWESVRDGTVDIVGTDHAPHTWAEKKGQNPPAGFPGLETAFPLLLTAWKNGMLTLRTLLRLTSGAAGSFFKISDRTCVKPGLQADFAVFREGNFVIGEEGYETKSGWSPFHGVMTAYKPFITAVRGFAAYDSGFFYKNPEKAAQIS